MANNISLSEILHTRPAVVPTIYGYILPDLKDHDGYIKVGYTDRKDTETRIREQLHAAAIKFKVLFKESAMRPDGTCFTDKDVHRLLRHKGFLQLNEGEDRNEWFKCTRTDALTAIKELRTETRFEGQRTWNFSMRNEQKAAVEMTKAYFEQAKTDDPARPPKFLWNAKMRFGKTFATYELCKAMGFKKILVLTFKPAVESAWQEDLSHHVDFKGWQFVSNKEAKFDAKKLDEQYDACDKTQPIVVFGSFQDLLGTNEAGGIKAKNEFIHTTNWDIVVFDEYHFGAWRENAKNLFEKFDEENDDFDLEKYQREEAGNAINETFLPITSAHYLYLSGTPFRALNSGEFLEDQVFNWTYSDEQAAKENWDKSLGENPYAALPKMVMLTYKVPDSITANVAINEGYDEFDINEFFRAEVPEKGKLESARFVYEEDVQKWLKMIQGNYMPVDGLKLGAERPPMPFSDTTLLNVLSHTLWFLPNVASCYAMQNLLQQKQNNFFNDYKIIVCAGPKAGIGLDALHPVLNAMGDPLETKTITLSCGKLTTGVTVRPWAGVFMLRNLKSPETYFQTAFRVQSPWEVVNDHGDKEVIKQECYIFDFALERALHQISDYSCRLKVDDASPEQKVSEFISFLPVLAFDGSSMNRIDAQDILDITYAGTSATLLAKRWQTALLVHVDNDTLKKLQANQDALDALMRIEGFRSLNTEIQTIINRSEKVNKLKKEKGDELTPSAKKELTEEEKKVKSLRKQVQENLLKLAARIPAFMYLTDYREQTIKDVITQIEPELFQKVTGLTVKDFDVLCSIGLFDSEKMNQGIFGFRKYENSSLSYTGIDKHEGEAVGGWDTVLRREEYEALYSKQQATMTDFEQILIPKRYRDKKTIEDKSAAGSAEHIVSDTSGVDTIKSDKDKWEEILLQVKVGITVTHEKFGNGTITWMSVDKKYMRVKFAAREKQFVFPDAFLMEYLKLK
ncbi:MAG TPA: GIY-YIG nuclease family protein [Candidatus Ornithoclostridium excrementipullorum]|nr:GIY-YIG nuclease family protein [Candidatus Ornithoclostridium excrementipullorum]